MTDAEAKHFDECVLPTEVRGVNSDGENIEKLMECLHIEDGDAVVLRHRGNDIYIHNVMKLDGVYQGKLKTSYFHEDFKLFAGSDFTFQDKHAFRVNRYTV